MFLHQCCSWIARHACCKLLVLASRLSSWCTLPPNPLLSIPHSHPPGSHESLGQQEREVAWVAGEPEAGVVAALADTVAAPGLVHEAVHVTLHTASGPLLGVVAAAGFGAPVRLALQVAKTGSRLVGVELVRTSGTAALPTSLALALWQELEAAAVTRLRWVVQGSAWVGSCRAGPAM